MATRAALPQLEELESRRVFSAPAPHVLPPGGYELPTGPSMPVPPRLSAWAAGASPAAAQPRPYRVETADDLEDAREAAEDADKPTGGSSGHGGGSGAVTLSPAPLPLGAGDDVMTPTKTSFIVAPPASTDPTAGLLKDALAASQNDPKPDAHVAGGSVAVVTGRVAQGAPALLAWASGGGEEMAPMPASASWLAKFSSEPIVAEWRSLAVDAKPLAAAAEVAVSSVLRQAVSTVNPAFAADSTEVAVAPLLTATRPDAVIALADAMTRFVYESAAAGPLFSAVASGSHVRAWAITSIAALGDAALVAYLYAGRRKAPRRSPLNAK